jgi:hypothetical protein
MFRSISQSIFVSTLFFAALIITVTRIWLLVAKNNYLAEVRVGQSSEIKIKVKINQGKS